MKLDTNLLSEMERTHLLKVIDTHKVLSNTLQNQQSLFLFSEKHKREIQSLLNEVYEEMDAFSFLQSNEQQLHVNLLIHSLSKKIEKVKQIKQTYQWKKEFL